MCRNGNIFRRKNRYSSSHVHGYIMYIIISLCIFIIQWLAKAKLPTINRDCFFWFRGQSDVILSFIIPMSPTMSCRNPPLVLLLLRLQIHMPVQLSNDVTNCVQWARVHLSVSALYLRVRKPQHEQVTWALSVFTHVSWCVIFLFCIIHVIVVTASVVIESAVAMFITWKKKDWHDALRFETRRFDGEYVFSDWGGICV